MRAETAKTTATAINETKTQGAPAKSSAGRARQGALPTLAFAALGIVFGDIGTSPLYAFSACFSKTTGLTPSPDHILGLCATIFWVLVGVVCVKYVGFILRADHDGEGGTLALLALLADHVKEKVTAPPTRLALLVLIGSAMLYGDGVITPAVSVLSAVEGLNVATSAAQHFILPIAVVILIALFAVQSRGTGRIGAFFGPIMLLWFAAIALLGVGPIVAHPQILAAFNPLLVVSFFATTHVVGFFVLGAVVLTVTGVEALYADLAHFGRRPISLAWFAVVFPALTLAYFGQGALALADPKSLDVGFFALVPQWALYPMVALATLATIIASQALISGVFSLTQQAIQLGFCPPSRIVHTSEKVSGQIYMPLVNVLLGIACIAITVGFGSSAKLTAAYGLAVTVTMFITSITYYSVIRRVFGWPRRWARALLAFFLLFDLSFFVAGLPKVLQGGWVPIVLCAIVFTTFTTWTYGRLKLRAALAAQATPSADFERELSQRKPIRLDGTAAFISAEAEDIPFVLGHQFVRDHVMYERAIVLSIAVERVPFVDESQRVERSDVAPGIIRIIGHYGFMQEPDAQEVLACAKLDGFTGEAANVTYYIADPHFVATAHSLPKWSSAFFGFLYRNARQYSDYLHIVPEQTVRVGVEVRL